jgi:hypothetical protein
MAGFEGGIVEKKQLAQALAERSFFYFHEESGDFLSPLSWVFTFVLHCKTNVNTPPPFFQKKF